MFPLRILLAALALAGLGIGASGCTSQRDASKAKDAHHVRATRTSAPADAYPSESASVPGTKPGPLSALTSSQLAGQRLIYAYSGLVPPPSLLALIRHGEAAGVIFFGPNVASSKQLRAVSSELQAAAASSPIPAPLLLMTDQEGGQVKRLPGPPERAQKQIGKSPHPAQAAREAGAQAAEALAAAGLNTNLAPVLDVFREPGNFIDQYERSYSSNPTLVASLGSKFIEAQQNNGVNATAKHFPGLGAATRDQDTDEAPVTLKIPLDELRTVDERPYKVAIAADVHLVMLSWAMYPALDQRNPAGLSPTIIQGELRDRLHFRGVTITDSIEAGALAPVGGTPQRALRAAAAGDDLLLCSARHPEENTPAIGTSALRALASAIASHRISRTTAEEAAEQVIRLRQESLP